MNRVPVRMGPLALLLTVISICLATLSVLTMTTAQADRRLAERYAKTMKERYALEKEGQAELAGFLSGESILLPEMDGTYRIELERDGAKLTIGLREENGVCVVTSWRHERSWEEDDSIGELWPGFGGFGF